MSGFIFDDTDIVEEVVKEEERKAVEERAAEVLEEVYEEAEAEVMSNKCLINILYTLY